MHNTLKAVPVDRGDAYNQMIIGVPKNNNPHYQLSIAHYASTYHIPNQILSKNPIQYSILSIKLRYCTKHQTTQKKSNGTILRESKVEESSIEHK